MEPHEVERRPVSRGPNTSAAVMQQRREAKDSLDDFPTPPWATRAICEELMRRGVMLSAQSVREPCANRGMMVEPLTEYFGAVEPSDVHDYGVGYRVQDYLFGLISEVERKDWTFMNPPFRLAEEFILRALETSNCGVAAIVRSAFLEGIGRYERLFSRHAPWGVFQFVERVPMVRGRYDPEASSATSYSWIIWRRDTQERLPLAWIAPCRVRLERPEDEMIGTNPRASASPREPVGELFA